MSVNRREFIRRTIAASALVAAGIVGLLELFDTKSNGEQQPPGLLTLLATNSTTVQELRSSTQTTSKSTSQTPSQTAPSGYILVAPLSALNGKTSAYFNHPSFGLSLLLLFSGQWKAFDATCTHQPCTVNFTGSEIYCPCHAGTFDPSNGSVTGGPPPTPLSEYGVLIQNNNLYVTSKVIN